MSPRIEIDRELMARAMKLSGRPTKRATVEAALLEFCEARDPKAKRAVDGRGVLELAGKVGMAPISEIRPGWEPSDPR